MRAGGTNAHRHRYRCNRCKYDLDHQCSGRFTLKNNKQEIKCPCCGETERIYDAEINEQKRNQRRSCNCNAYPFLHRKGGMRMCEHHKLKEVEPTEEEWRDYQGCLETERSG